MKRLFRSMIGKQTPSEIICRPTKYKLEIVLSGGYKIGPHIFYGDAAVELHKEMSGWLTGNEYRPFWVGNAMTIRRDAVQILNFTKL